MPHNHTLSDNTVDGGEGITLAPVASGGRSLIMSRKVSRHTREPITHPVKIALDIMLAGGPLTRKGHFWYGAGGDRVAYQTIEAMFTRALCKIVTESRHRRKQIAELTEIGLRCARDLKREREHLADDSDHFE